ncbi:hypothetical protein BpHYR1_005655, partial [Brachionus plicatilis]
HANFNNFIRDIWSSSTKNIPLEIVTTGDNSTNLTSFQTTMMRVEYLRLSKKIKAILCRHLY